jgi:hypothetical protein
MEGIGGVFRLLNKLLEFFQQKAFVYVDVAFNSEKLYEVTVINHSKFDVHLNYLNVEPDGFPSVENGWSINDAGLFRDKMLKPSQRIRFCLSSNDIGKHGKRRFLINYSTILCGKRVPRYEQTCEYDFDLDTHNVKVASTATINYEVINR